MPPPPPSEDDAPTMLASSARQIMAGAQASGSANAPVVIQARVPTPAQLSPIIGRSPTPPPIPSRPPPVPHKSLPDDFRIDSNPEIEISVDDEASDRVRAPRDTAVEIPLDSTVPNAVPDLAAARRSDSGPVRRTQTGDRPPSLVGATLPPARQPQRPSFTPPQVLARPLPSPDGRSRDSDAVELYAPPPPSADPPPGERTERPGQYSVKRGKSASDGMSMREQTGRVPVQPPPPKTNPPGTRPPSQPAATARAQPGSRPPPLRQTPAAGSPVSRPPTQPRPNVTSQMASRGPQSSVVMTRPAVVVGAPPKPTTPPARVRKAREDEGRSFGQGLISEKSLDEVILAYLSEDAEEK
jgi:hypothetical protein